LFVTIQGGCKGKCGQNAVPRRNGKGCQCKPRFGGDPYSVCTGKSRDEKLTTEVIIQHTFMGHVNFTVDDEIHVIKINVFLLRVITASRLNASYSI